MARKRGRGARIDRDRAALHRARRPHEVGLRRWKIRTRTRAVFAPRSCSRTRTKSAYYEIDKNRPLSFEEIKSDLVLSNGARFYNDHAHPEYSTPECTTLREIVAQDKAGERILAECARRRNQKLPAGTRSAALQEQHRFRRPQLRLPRQLFDAARRAMGPHRRATCVPFLVTRQIFAGAGKMGVEARTPRASRAFTRSRSVRIFSACLLSIDTMNRRPLVNTRDEPHADAERYRRFHVIIGDANMSRMGDGDESRRRPRFVLDLIERGHAPQLELAQPIDATKSISRDHELRLDHRAARWPQNFRDRRATPLSRGRARSIARTGRGHDLAAARMGTCAQRSRSAITGAAADRARLGGEEVSAQHVAGERRNSPGAIRGCRRSTSSITTSLLDRGLFYELMREGQMRRIVTEEEVKGSHLSAAVNDARVFSRTRGGEVQSRDRIDPMGRDDFPHQRHDAHGRARAYLPRRVARPRERGDPLGANL